MKITASKLATYVNKANRIKSLDSIFSEKINSSAISAYYKNAGVLYRRFHSPDGAMHLPIQTTETEKHKHKLLFQARSVEELIKKYNYKTIVELGCGTGFNSIYLARIFPAVQFIAFDITEANLNIGRANADGLTNLIFMKFNFNEDVHAYKADLIFGIETLCYSPDLCILFKNISTCLNTDGRIVIFDGYEKLPSQYKELISYEQKVYHLFCLGFALNRFQKLQEVYDAIKINDLIAEHEVDYTTGIMPSYKTFHEASKKLLKFPLLTKLLLSFKIIPYELFLQALSGFFGIYFFERNFLTYNHFIIKRNK